MPRYVLLSNLVVISNIDVYYFLYFFPDLLGYHFFPFINISFAYPLAALSTYITVTTSSTSSNNISQINDEFQSTAIDLLSGYLLVTHQLSLNSIMETRVSPDKLATLQLLLEMYRVAPVLLPQRILHEYLRQLGQAYPFALPSGTLQGYK